MAGAYVIACGALAREIESVMAASGLEAITVEYLSALLHNRPSEIPALVDARLEAAAATHDTLFVAYADCGTGGLLDPIVERHGASRLPGAHCYEFFAGSRLFAELQEAVPGTFYLTDYLARNFERLVWAGLGLDRWPELRDTYFGSYTRLVYLAQTDDPATDGKARAAAAVLGLDYERRLVGLGTLEPALISLGAA